MNTIRKSGILLHPSSLSGTAGIGTIGKAAFDFVDWLEKAGQTLWQVLPLGPTGYGDSPYSSYSAFAGNPLLIDMDILIKDGYLNAIECLAPDSMTETGFIDFEALRSWKMPLLRIAAQDFLRTPQKKHKTEYKSFKTKNAFWLDDFANYMCKKEEQEADELHYEIQKVIQFFFFHQWKNLKAYANKKGVSIIGDIPIFVAADSVDVLTHPELFQLDKKGRPTVVAGVPPDYFSETGQLWGNPLYNWDAMEKDNYNWWCQRVKNSLTLFDYIRIDHFRGFESYWAVPASAKTAEKGKWLKGPGEKLFKTLKRKLGNLPIIAEDLGVITDAVADLRDKCNLPGMKVLQFAFNPEELAQNQCVNNFLPHTFTTPNCVIYTGTHDNDTLQGWINSAEPELIKMLHDYLGECVGIDIPNDHLAPAIIKLAFASTANIAIIPMQDIYSLGTETRMNTPSTVGGTNWRWRMTPDMIFSKLADDKTTWLKHLSGLYGRNFSSRTI